MMKKLVVALLVVAVCVVIALLVRFNGEPDLNRLSFSGNIELTQVEIGFKVPGTLAEFAVEEGDLIESGTMIARLDAEQVLQNRERAEAQLRALESRRGELRAGLRFQEATRDAQITQRQADLNQAKASLEELLAGSREQEIREAEALLERAEATFQKAAQDWKRAQELYRNEDISTSQYDQFRAWFEDAEAARRQALQRLSLVREGPRKERIEAARAAVQRAEGALAQAQALNLDLERLRAALQSLESEIRAAGASLGVIESQVRDHQARAPMSGVVLLKSAELGEVVAAGSSILTLGDVNRPWVRGYVPEEELGRVKLGQRVEVRTDSYPGKTYIGKVTFVSSKAEFTPKQIETREERVKLVYRIKVELENPHGELKLNMPVDAWIDTSSGSS